MCGCHYCSPGKVLREWGCGIPSVVWHGAAMLQVPRAEAGGRVPPRLQQAGRPARPLPHMRGRRRSGAPPVAPQDPGAHRRLQALPPLQHREVRCVPLISSCTSHQIYMSLDCCLASRAHLSTITDLSVVPQGGEPCMHHQGWIDNAQCWPT